MQQRLMKRRGWRWIGLAVIASLAGWVAWQWQPEEVQAESNAAPLSRSQEAVADGRELFHRSWLPEDPRSPEGDGLGPLFNETSCAACHNQGGSGGGGPTSKNVELLTAFVNQPMMPTGPAPASSVGSTVQPQVRSNSAEQRKAIVKELMKIHPEFEKSSSVVIHRFGTSSKHNQWRTNLLMSPHPQQLQGVHASPFDDTLVAQANFSPPQATFVESETDLSLSQPPSAVPSDSSPPTPPTQPPSGTPSAQPAPQPVPLHPTTTFQQVPQFATPSVVGFGSTGIPLVDEALQEMRRLQQEARRDLSGSMNRGRVLLVRSQRNTSALFGAGVIDAIPDAVIEAAAKQKHDDFPRVSGRVHRLPDNKIGKFGWKAQKATLREFTLAACANELGLDLPEHPQPAVPYEAHEKPKGHDMTEKEADALVAFVRNLPAPIQEIPNDKEAAKLIEQGKELFESVGCAVCHKQDMGEARGIYSDLLLHDMGEQLQASGSYGSSFVPQEFDPHPGDAPAETNAEESPAVGPESLPGGSRGSSPQPQPRTQTAKPQGATAGEWRTPPLWGVRDSAPYLHDGRAATLEQAIALHGGEGSDAAIRFFMLPAKKQQRIIAFLKTLRAPEQQAVVK